MEPVISPPISKHIAVNRTKKLQKQMYDLLYLMFAHDRYSLLIILQGIDTAGKDGTVRHLFAGANPQGIRVYSFKVPTPEEYRHDFLWRCHMSTPESGLTAIFNRSYYEEVTTVAVHPELLLKQHLPPNGPHGKELFQERYDRINDFEKLLVQKGTVILKFFLHITKEKQDERLHQRIDHRSKNWKFSPADIEERQYWNEYMKVFEKMIDATSTKYAKWIVVPADKKWYRNYLVSKSVVHALSQLKMSFPKTEALSKNQRRF